MGTFFNAPMVDNKENSVTNGMGSILRAGGMPGWMERPGILFWSMDFTLGLVETHHPKKNVVANPKMT